MNEVVFIFEDSIYEHRWVDGSLLNPKWSFELYHSDRFSGFIDNPLLNESLLFGIGAVEYEGFFYGGFEYDPIPLLSHRESREDVGHYYTINVGFTPRFDTEEKAILWALDRFLSMYNSIDFQYKLFVYHNLFEYCINKLWIDKEGENVSLSDSNYMTLQRGTVLYKDKLAVLAKRQEVMRRAQDELAKSLLHF